MIHNNTNKKKVILHRYKNVADDVIETDSETGNIFVNIADDTTSYQTTKQWETCTTFKDKTR